VATYLHLQFVVPGLNRPARIYAAVTVVAGLVTLAAGLSPWRSDDMLRFVCYFLIANLASGFKVSLPGITGTMSVNFVFVLICVTTLTLPETLTIAFTGTILQCVWRSKSMPKLIKLLFNVASISMAVTAASHFYHLERLGSWGVKPPLMLVLAACVYFVTNTLPVAIIVSLTEGKNLIKIWRECYFWSFPYYLAGAAIAGVLAIVNRMAGWETSLLILPLLYWIYRSYRLYLGRLEHEKAHVEEMAGLHLRTIEALALAIEAKDYHTYHHLRRVGIYAVEIGKELGLSEPEMRALQAASLLHDIGKLAVPEHIISKPGKLTPGEFEKMKIHPLIGAEILEQVEFPYPVAPIVKAHHEKWDGSGYPLGLKGEEIPIGARILTAVDCFDAMTSDRQYRRAIPVEATIEYIVAESGKSYDPIVVEILARRYKNLETLVEATRLPKSRLSKHVKVPLGAAPAAGFEPIVQKPTNGDFLSSIAAARQEAQVLFELAHELGNSLSLDETLSVLSLRLKRMCPHDCIAIYVLRDNVLVPEYVSGENFQLFSSLRIPMGDGLSGWVAQTTRSIVNGNPSVEPGYLDDPERYSTLRSALSVPLEGTNGVVGVLSLYAAAADNFTPDHLRILSAVTTKIALSIENALKYLQAESCATTDALTELPNARSLFMHLDAELSRSKREGSRLSVLVCDLDGFKQVNDRFGHLEGNKVLRNVAHALRVNCRASDYVARMGGDEFVVVLPGYPEEAVQAKIRMLADAARDAGRDVVNEDLLTLSVGEASYPADGIDAEQLLADADRRMYKAKRLAKGRAPVEPARDLTRLGDSLNGAGRGARFSPSAAPYHEAADGPSHQAAVSNSL
jgi:diguanylate cyclase (GGDEF)-like protein/putative nucleotidyltransferase with HDIG domain